MEEIRKDAGYAGARVLITGEIAKARCKTQIDIGFGDAVTPGPVKAVKGAKAKVAKPRKPVAAKYRNAATNEAWSGRGRVPKWLAAELAKGRKREEFLVG